ncbi:MAG: hypothetical protein HY648_06325 [Acidobacteria bacterium]|nr:hypothetical protein [Acidobacteriota bacterium]
MFRAAIVVLTIASCAGAQVPAPQIEWLPWATIGTCGGVEYSDSITKDDGRNEFEVKLKARNTTNHLVATRFEAVLLSEEGEKNPRQGNSRIPAGREVEASPLTPSFHLGTPFPTPVKRPVPIQIKRLVLTTVETANVETPPPGASPSAYLNDFRDFPKDTCSNLTYDFPARLSLDL